MRTLNLKKVFLTAMILSLTLAALTGIGVFLLGNFGELELRILLTTLEVGIFSMTSLCCAALLEKKKSHPVGLLGLLSSAVSLVLITIIIWGTWQDSMEILSKTAIISLVLAMSLAHAALLLLIPGGNRIAMAVRNMTLFVIAIVAGMNIYLIVNDWEFVNEMFYRLMGVLAILDVFGTVMSPVLLKFMGTTKATKKKK